MIFPGWRRAATGSWRHLEAVAVPLETEAVVERVRALAPQVGGERHLVAAGLAAYLACEDHHGASHALPLLRRVDRHRLDHRRSSAVVAQVALDEQREGADDAALPLGDV